MHLQKIQVNKTLNSHQNIEIKVPYLLHRLILIY